MNQRNGASRRKNDILWKGILERVFDDLLRFVFPDADQIFNLERGFEFLEKELGEMHPQPGKRSDTRFVDKLVKVFQRDGSEEWVLCHVEVQGTNDKNFARRMFKYYARIFDRFDRPLTAIAIFTGRMERNCSVCIYISIWALNLSISIILFASWITKTALSQQ